MAEVRHGILLGDKVPATVAQVVKVVTEKPPFSPGDLANPCFPGVLIGCTDVAEWKRRSENMIEEFDKRMQILHVCNLIWRKVTRTGDGRQRITYYRPDERLRIPTLPADLQLMPFRDIQPEGDKRFLDFYVRDGIGKR